MNDLNLAEGGAEQKKWYEKMRFQIPLVLGIIALFTIVLGLVLDWYIEPQTSTQKKDLVQALGLITAGVAGAVGIFFTWRGQRLAREAQQENQKNTQSELDITRRGQITERFTQAIDQLGMTDSGKRKLEVRLGGIYSLERTAREDRDYHWPIMEVLSSYVRQHSPRDLGNEATNRDSDSPVSDIQAILTVIGRRSEYHSDVEYGSIDLSETHLRGANLRKANLRKANLRGANLRGANLRGANLQDANLQDANLQDANLQGAKITDAQLEQARVD